jgi:FMN phosphatase YigB (HAD superfamily)
MSLFVKVIFFDLGMTLVDPDTKRWIPGAQAVLKALPAEGVRLGIISNAGAMTRTQLKKLLPADFDFNIFEAKLVVLSSEVKIEKPRLDIFRLAVKNAGITAAQCLYCSENLLETLAAQRAGMSAARVIPPPNGDLKDLVQTIRSVPS